MTTAQDQQSRTELLPCPFCGGAASAHEVDPRGAPGWFHLTVRHRDGCLHRPSKEILLLNADDLERWNRRAPAEQAARALPARGVDARLDTPAGLEPDFFLDGGTLPCFYASTVLAMGRVPPGFVAAPVEPTAEMVDAAEEAYMPFGDMALAIQSAVAAAPRPPAAQERKTMACACGDEFPIDSYGAGFLDAKGKCFGCDAADEAAHGIKEAD